MRTLGGILEAARRARGLTQEAVSRQAQITQAALSRYENDLREPGDDAIVALARVLDISPRLLQGAPEVAGALAVDVHMRRRATAKPTQWRRLEAQLNMLRLHARQLFEEVSVVAEYDIPRLDPIETPPADAARIVRMQWRMPAGPVRQLVRWLESAGCVIFEETFDTRRIDGLSQWIGDHPVMLLNTGAPTDRKRLTVAHELGHLVLHTAEWTPNVETEANEFAAEFLMPEAVIRPELRNLSIGRLHDLKRKWGVSMQALIERAHALGILDSAKRTQFYKTFSMRGWRKREPLSEALAPEDPSMPRRIGKKLRERGLSAREINLLAGFGEDSKKNPFVSEDSHLHVVVPD